MQSSLDQSKPAAYGIPAYAGAFPNSQVTGTEASDEVGRGVAQILRGDIRLPSPPAVAMRIIRAFKKENVSAEELVRIVASDPALAARVLRLANSPLYTRSGKIESIKKAVAVLGTRVLKNIALSFVFVDGISSSWGGSFDFESLWRRSITAAACACIVSQLFGRSDEDVFMSALLQDIGEAILALHTPEKYRGLRNGADPESQIIAEREAFGTDHQEIGHRVLTEWELPSDLCDLVRCHHSIESAGEGLREKLRVLDPANALSSILHGNNTGQNFERFTTCLRGVHPSSTEEIERIISSAHDRAKEVLAFFDISTGAMKSCSQILQEANEELGKLNFTYEQLVLQLRQAKEEAERNAAELAAANSKLQELAYRDPLTGLFNHGYFQQLLERELARASRYSRPFSLILFDLDRFKNINDRHGHPVGDEVLRWVSKIASQNVRQCDYVARYGGEEFAVILPETDSKGASVLAERMRRTIERTCVNIGKLEIYITISIGIFTFNSELAEMTKQSIVSAADKALYSAKHSGRNKICIYR
jgi:diguanylate cyclase (GGDEF)-like protein